MIALPTFDDICAIIITRGDVPLDEILDTLPYAEVIVRYPKRTNHYAGWRDGERRLLDTYQHTDLKIYGRYDAMLRTEKPIIYFQDDDIVFTEHEALLAAYEPGRLVANMGQEWVEAQSYHDLALVGLGSLIDRRLSFEALDRYDEAFPDDERFLIDADFAHGVLVPHKKVDLGAKVLPVASADNRLWRQPEQMDGKWNTIAQARSLRKVVLTMLAKNEEKRIATALESALGLYDSLLVIDTGSTDETQLEISRFCTKHSIPFEILERPWVNFSHNRNELLAEGSKRGDYMFLMDCDETLENVPKGGWEHLLAHGIFLHYAGELDYAQPRLLFSSWPWYFEGTSHAALTCDGEAAMMDQRQPLIVHHGDGRHGLEKLKTDVVQLTEDLANDLDTPRSYFMRAKAYEGLSEHDKAIEDYRARLEFSQGDEEAYYARFRLGCLLIERRGEFPEGADHLMTAFLERPSRVESIRALAHYLTVLADKTPYPVDDKVIVHRNMYTDPV